MDGKKKRALIATLGESPAVITFAADLLRRNGKMPSTICMITTLESHNSSKFLFDHISMYYGIEKKDLKSVKISRKDVTSDEDAIDFMAKACQILKTYGTEHECYVCIAGGRKSMSALLALSVQFYGAEMLFHVYSSGDDTCDIYDLRDEEILKEKLHPELDPIRDDSPKLVEIPFMDMSLLRPKIIDVLRKENMADKSIKEMLAASDLIDENGRATDLWLDVAGILDVVESLPPVTLTNCEILISEGRRVDFLKMMAEYLSENLLFATKIQNIDWKYSKEKVVSDQKNCRIAIMCPQDDRLGLELNTTARSEEELEAARKMTAEYMDKFNKSYLY